MQMNTVLKHTFSAFLGGDSTKSALFTLDDAFDFFVRGLAVDYIHLHIIMNSNSRNSMQLNTVLSYTLYIQEAYLRGVYRR